MRLALNSSESRGTETGRFVSKFAGAGVHHVAFAAPDIERAARALQALGAPILPVPANYHDDLAARWGLDDAALTVLQQHALLYDRELPGELPGASTPATVTGAAMKPVPRSVPADPTVTGEVMDPFTARIPPVIVVGPV